MWKSLLAAACLLLPLGHATAAPAKPRVIVTTDPELDDSNSLLRYLLSSADFRTEGLIYASSGPHWKGDGKGTTFFSPTGEYRRFGLNLCPCTSWRWAPDERFVHDNVEAYAKAYPNLKAHDPAYPKPDDLRAKIRWGNIEFEGDISKDSEGSALIRQVLLDRDPAPVYLLAWGGGSTLARALKSIKDEYQARPEWPRIRDAVSRKAIIQAFGDQDGTYAKYVKPEWPAVEFRQMSTRTYGYGARGAVLPADQQYLTADWTRANISSRGPMGERYRVWGDGKQMVKGDIFDYFGLAGLTPDQLKAQGYIVFTPPQDKGSWISEGDTSTFMNLLDNGLRGFQQASWGGWGGRGGVDAAPAGPDPNYASARFFGAAQRDLAARFLWAVTPNYRDANHPPQITVAGPLDRTAKPGETLRLSARTRDPDGDPVTVRWWAYREAGTYPGTLPPDADGPTLAFRIPADAKPGETIHLIAEARDAALSRYRRIVIRIAG